MLPGAFPVPRYDLLGEGGFDGVFSDGTLWSPDTVAGKTVVSMSFGFGNNLWNRPLMEERQSEVFFTLVTVVDTLDADGYAVNDTYVTSRNHPDIVGEGVIQNTGSPIEAIAFVTAENQRFALVNLRLFDLSFGDIIVVVPQDNGSFRSLQLDAPPRTKHDVDTYVREAVLRDSRILALLTEDGVIGG